MDTHHQHRTTVLLVTLLLLIASVAMMPQATNAQSTIPDPISVDRTAVSLPAGLDSAITNAIINRPATILPGTSFRLLAARVEGSWALVTFDVVNGQPNIEDLGSGERGSVILAHEYAPATWEAVLRDTKPFEMLLQQTPEWFIAPANRAAFLDNTLIGQSSGIRPLAQPIDYRFPWAAGVTGWLTSYRDPMWHSVAGSGSSASAAVDIFFLGDWRVLASTGGVVSNMCTGSVSINLTIRDDLGYTMGYAHLEKAGFDTTLLGKRVERGQVLGTVKPNTWSDATCGSYTEQNASSAHIHWSVPQYPAFVVDGWTISYPNNYLERNGVFNGPNSYFVSTNQVYIPVSPVMYIDTPGNGATVSGNISFSGWATHAAAASGTGVDAVHIYFDGGAGTGARGVAATYGLQRDDVAAAFGDRYRYSGYQLVLHSSEFSLGQHTIYVYAHSTVTDQWQTTTRTFTVGNISPNTPTSMTPAPGATISGQTVQFAWQDPGDPDNRPRNSRDYAIEVRNSTGQIVAQMPWALTTTWSTNLANGTYTWHIQSGDGLTGSAWSADRSFTVLANPIPAAPDSLQVISRTANSLRLTWRDNATNETGYRVYRWNGSIWAQLATLGAGATSYTDTYLNYPFGYSYLVAAFNAAGERSATTWASGYIANAVSDFNNDGATDILWRNTVSGLNYTYFMRGASIVGSGAVNTLASLNWKVAGTADFNGDGLNDILWRNVVTGQNTIYFMSGATIISSATINIVADQNWKIAGVADTNNDGRADILWRNTLTGQNALYLMNGALIVSSTAINTVAIPDWQIVGFDDFNFDNRADILWRNTRTGQNVLYLMNGAQIVSSAVINTVAVPDWKVVGTGDTNGDGRADILWRNTRTGTNVLYLMNGAQVVSSAVINTVAVPDWKVVGTGDSNGDGRADILWHNTRTGTNVLYLMNGTTILSAAVINTVADLTWKIVGKGSNTEASVGQGLASIIDQIPAGASNGLTMASTDGGDIATMLATDGGDISTMATDGGDISTMATDGGDISTMATDGRDMLGPNGETASDPPSGEQPLREPTLADLPPSAQPGGAPSGTTQITLPMVISPIQ